MNQEFEFENKNNAVQYPDYEHELTALIKSNLSPKALKERLSDYHDNDIADILELLGSDERMKLYRILDAQELADILEYAEEPSVYLKELPLRKCIDVLCCMDSASTAEYLKGIEKNERMMLVELLPEDVRADVTLLLSFDEDEIGSIMTTNYVEITCNLSVKEAMSALVEQAAENDNIGTIYVVDENQLYYGAIDLKDLIIAREDTPLTSIVATQYPYLYAEEQIADCVERIKKYSEDSIPVLDGQNKLLGVITAQDFIQVVDDEMGEDYAMLAGLTAEEDLNEPVSQSVKKRLPWLFVLLGLGLVVSAVVGLFEAVVARLTLVICFQSLILDMAGNVGTQSLAVTIRVLMDERLSGKEKVKLVLKESRVGLTNGLILGVSSFVIIGGYIFLFKGQSLAMSLGISACIGAALLLAMLFSSVVGTVVPIFFKKVHVDPAVASGPLITTINDLVAVVTYYGLTWLFLIRLLHVA